MAPQGRSLTIAEPKQLSLTLRERLAQGKRNSLMKLAVAVLSFNQQKS